MANKRLVNMLGLRKLIHTSCQLQIFICMLSIIYHAQCFRPQNHNHQQISLHEFAKQPVSGQSIFQLYASNEVEPAISASSSGSFSASTPGGSNSSMPIDVSAPATSTMSSNKVPTTTGASVTSPTLTTISNQLTNEQLQTTGNCAGGLQTFELSTGFIYKPVPSETLDMKPSTLLLTSCLDHCLKNASCLAINFEMGLCVLLSSSAERNPHNLHSSQFPVFTIYAEKKCLLAGGGQTRQRRKCQRAWAFERVAGYELRTRPRRRLKLASRELCMEACLLERDFQCRSANWYQQTGECSLSEQDRHTVSQSEAGDQKLKLSQLYGPSNLTLSELRHPASLNSSSSLYQNYYMNSQLLETMATESRGPNQLLDMSLDNTIAHNQFMASSSSPSSSSSSYSSLNGSRSSGLNKQSNKQLAEWISGRQQQQQQNQQAIAELPMNAAVDYLENNCIQEPNKLCEFRKIQNRILKTADSIYQDVLSLEECKQKCLNAPFRCYSFDYDSTAEHVCRLSHLDQASLLSVKEPYLEIVGAITYELASCFNVSVQCKAREMLVQVSSSKMFRGRIYAKSRPTSCLNDVRESLNFELSMRYHDDQCDVRSTSTESQGIFSNDLVIQHHDRIVTTQDVGLSVYCQYDLANRSITNNVQLAVERLDAQQSDSVASKTQSGLDSSSPSALSITSLATTVVRSPNVTMRITNMNGQPVTSATVGDRLALLFEIKEKTSPFGILIREIVATDGKQFANSANNASHFFYLANSTEQSFDSDGGASSSSSSSSSSQMSGSTYSSSVQMLDSNGCPTDANLMGPLTRLNSSGQRILAPFDAFKFPTSDMVFFRAVVTSCVFDCEPSACPGAQAAIDQPENSPSLFNYMSSLETTSQGNELVITTPDPLSERPMSMRGSPTTTDSSVLQTTTLRPIPSKADMFTTVAGPALGGGGFIRPNGLATTSPTTTTSTTSIPTRQPDQSDQQTNNLDDGLGDLRTSIKALEAIFRRGMAPAIETSSGSAPITSLANHTSSKDQALVGLYTNLLSFLMRGGGGGGNVGQESSLAKSGRPVTRTDQDQNDKSNYESPHYDDLSSASPASLPGAQVANDPMASNRALPVRSDKLQESRIRADKLASLEPYANNYMGALQAPPSVQQHRQEQRPPRTVGQRRKRRHLSSHQDVSLELADGTTGRGSVLLYLIPSVPKRRRRELVSPDAQPAAGPEELVVQSIKISDRSNKNGPTSVASQRDTGGVASRIASRQHIMKGPQSIKSARQQQVDKLETPSSDSPAAIRDEGFSRTALGLIFVAASLVSIQVAMLMICLVQSVAKVRKHNKSASSSMTLPSTAVGSSPWSPAPTSPISSYTDSIRSTRLGANSMVAERPELDLSPLLIIGSPGRCGQRNHHHHHHHQQQQQLLPSNSNGRRNSHLVLSTRQPNRLSLHH